MLELNDFEVATAGDGAEAIEKTRSWAPDLILMDLRMPRVDGFKAIKAIRTEETTRCIPIISISAWAGSKDKEQALRLGANDHFVKPIDFTRLLRTIGEFLKK
jgi:CheY-like chemotaxis protein